jgi:hypothetical protein
MVQLKMLMKLAYVNKSGFIYTLLHHCVIYMLKDINSALLGAVIERMLLL